MNAKEYLRGLKRMDVYIDQKQVELDMIAKNRIYLSSFSYDRDIVQTSPDGQGFTKASDKYIDMCHQINKEIDAFVEKRHLIISQIQALSRVEYSDILFKRYVEYKSLEEIAFEMSYDYNYTCNLHGEALKEFQVLHLSS